MLMRSFFTSLVAGALLLAPITSSAADRGPTTPEERKQALENIHAWQANPTGPQAKDQFAWVLKFFTEVPDLSVHVCTIFDKLPKGDKKDASVIFGGEFMAQAAFVIENPDRSTDRLAEYEAGAEGALRVYELLLAANPRDRQPYLDELIQRRVNGTLTEFVKERSAVACKN